MVPLHDALRAGVARSAPGPTDRRGVLVVGGAGAIGAALLERLLARSEFGRVAVVVTQPLATHLRHLATVPEALLAQPATPGSDDTALVVFDRPREVNGRERAFFQPQPQALPAVAAALRERGVRRLVVVMPHAPASLPEALKHGLASLDEQAVAALGFEQLVFVRPAQDRAADRTGGWLRALAHAVLGQLQLMIPQRDKPVRSRKVAELAAELAAQLDATPPGTRVAPPELVWQAAQVADVAALTCDWLHGRPLAELAPARQRM